MEGCRVAPLCVPAVDIPCAAEFFHAGQAAFLSRVQQCRVSPQQVLDVGVALFHQVQRCVTVTILLGRIGAVLGIQTEETVI